MLLLGFYCSSTTSNPTKCTSGDFSYAGSKTAADCATCPAGFACPAMDATPVPCPTGFYAASGAKVCSICPAGKFCPKPDTQTNVTGKKWTTAGMTRAMEVQPGYAWVSTSAEPLLCGAGTYWRSSDSSCPTCGSGKFCPIDLTTTPNIVGSAELACPAGFYNDK